MNHEIPSTPEKDTDRQKVFIKRNNTGNVHPAYLTAEKDEQGRSMVKWLELNPESGRMEEYTKPVAEQGLGSEAQEILRAQYEQQLAQEMGETAVEKTEVDQIHEEMDTLTANLSEDEKVAVWKYGTALSDGEISNAISGLKQYPHLQGEIVEKYRALMQRKSELLGY